MSRAAGRAIKTLRDAGLNAANAAARERALNNVSNASARSEQRRVRHPIDSRSIRARSRVDVREPFIGPFASAKTNRIESA
ncbi:hypothetical protein G5S35_15035 [Paraburkholderia tropica]|uniref:hypothetical protein n=1 Tax=Paraburkholderia tropica TaxID=92647 RepID=UPI0016021EA4|nr:hypothetical protein [Paraburkholderia tropica]QNB12988.1 hypothetical protein G5S35_15035 [Paraburkholderia tropica]